MVVIRFLLVFFLFTLTACGSTGRYALQQDVAPTRAPTLTEMENPIAKNIQPSRGGNKNYTVRGKDYQVLDNAEGFVEEGIASWYGRKFHGHLTSNGETYDMFAMSAAHKNLPLPTYVEVTNLANQKTAIVRVNDRGPFHPGRIIDLSYSAATKLGITASGTARVKIKAIATQPGGYIDLDAATNKQTLEQMALAITLLHQLPTQIKHDADEYRLLVGPIDDENQLQKLINNFQQSGYPAKRYTGELN